MCGDDVDTTNNNNKRFPAIKLFIRDVLNGQFIQQDNSFAPQELILHDNRTIKRVNLCGIIVQNNMNTTNPSILLDDGSGIINLRTFELSQHIQLLAPGTPVNVIGRPKQFMNIIYIIIEIIKDLPDKLWLEVWKKTTESITHIKPINNNKNDEKKENELKIELLISMIREKDNEAGADIDLLIKESNISNCEDIISELLLKGIIFEVSPGRIKILE